MARRLTDNVVLRDPQGGALCVFPAGTVPPGWAADLITADVWDAPQADQADAPPPAHPGEGDGPALIATATIEVEDPPPAPPRFGKGSGRDAWADYATALGVEVSSDMGRDAIIEAVERG